MNNALSFISTRWFLLLTAVLTLSTQAQNSDPLVYTVGQTFDTSSNSGSPTHHNYILWQPGDAATTFGKRFGIYSKSGDASATGNFERIGIQALQTSPSAIQAILVLGEKFDADGAALPERIVALQAEASSTPLPEGTPVPTSINPTVAQALAQIITIAKTDPEVLQSLASLGRAHPGIQMAIGLGWAIETPSTAVTTYEIREIDLADNDLRVIGRVTLDAANPQALLAPGRPFQVPHSNDPNLQLAASAKDHLAVRLRWGVPNALRALLPHTYGYNIYRVPKSAVDATVEDPNNLAVAEDIRLLGGVKVNLFPVPASQLLTDAEAGNLTIQPDTFFYGDSKNLPDDPFADGDIFYYYVAARDIAGHPGPLSQATQITICDRLPPSVPTLTSVENVFDLASADLAEGTGTQHLRLTIRQVPDEPAENTAEKYYIYRWHAPNDWIRHGGDPTLNLIGEVAHIPGETFAYFDDNDTTDLDTDGIGGSGPDGLGGVDTGAPVVTSEDDPAMGQTFWYTVRAVDSSACTPANLSGHCGALYGVPRDRVGPPQPTGSLTTCFCIANIRTEATAKGTTEKKSYRLDSDFSGFAVRVYRDFNKPNQGPELKVKSFEVEVLEANNQPSFSRTTLYEGIEFYRDVVVPLPDSLDRSIRVRVHLSDDSSSEWFSISGENRTATAINIDVMGFYQFFASTKTCCPVLISSAVLRPDGTNVDPAISALLPPASNDPDCPSWIELTPGSPAPPHNPVGSNGQLTGVQGNVYLSDDVREVRIYRRVGTGGPLTMVDQQSGPASIPTPFQWEEAAPILTPGVTVCYYAQTFDEHGNSSPLTLLSCVTIVNDNLAVPMLTNPVSLPAVNDTPLIELSWFCDPVGVDRFEVWAAAEGLTDPQISADNLSGRLSSDTSPTLETRDSGDLVFSLYRTRSLSSGFGNGAEFNLQIEVPANQKLHFVVRAISKHVPDLLTQKLQHSSGDFSNAVAHAWTGAFLSNANDNGGLVPWPAKPLPNVSSIAMPIAAYSEEEGPYYATSFTPNNMNTLGASGAILVGIYPQVQKSAGNNDPNFYAQMPRDIDPLDWIFKYRKQPNAINSSSDLESLVPFVVYRHQLPSTRFPNAQANLIQITPLIDRMSYDEIENSELKFNQVTDPFFLFNSSFDNPIADLNVPATGDFTRTGAKWKTEPLNTIPSKTLPNYLKIPDVYSSKGDVAASMWIRDTQPVMTGAHYQYLIVSFSERGEIKRVIPTNSISH